MASILQEKYDVFLSFRSVSNQDSLTCNLYAALCQKKIKTYMDNDFDRNEEAIFSKHLRIIEEAKIKVVIFSKHYIDSPCCLDELVKILECKRMVGHFVLPIFYFIKPSDINDLAARFDDVFVERDLQQDRDRVKRWKDALIEAVHLSGRDSQSTRSENHIIEGVVKDILKKLNDPSLSNVDRLVGIESHIENLGKILCTGSAGVQIIGIWGMGGIGKTTIAEAIFNHICSEFESCCFLANVREESENRGLVRLRNELLSRILCKENLYVGAPIAGNNFIRNRLRRKKVLIVLDDVNNLTQLDYLVGENNRFGPGSRIIITTRDKHLLRNGVDEMYEVKGLEFKNALQLFSWNAFEQDHPVEHHLEISKRISKYTKGVPLALKVLGSFLHNRSKQEWESTLMKLERTPNKEIQNVLRVSYDGLEDEEKDIFLDIACFFKRETRDEVMKILDGCGFAADIGISVLIDKSLISVSHDRISMHDLLQEMGWEIIRQESLEEPGKRSRLFQHEDIYHVLTRNTGTEVVEGISLDMSKITEVFLSANVFAKMHRLRFLRFYSSLYHGGSKSEEDVNFREFFGSRFYGGYKEGSNLQISQGLKSFSNQLRFLQWNKYPLRSLPSNFCPQNLVELNMPHSQVEHLWDGVQDLVKLKKIDLGYSPNLIEAPDLSRALNLERMVLSGCTSLVEVPSSIQYLDKLDILDMRGCKSFRSFPSNICLKSLKRLTLSDCSSLSIFPEISLNLKDLYLDGTAIEEVPSSIECLSGLVTLNMKNCARLAILPDSICKLKSLRDFFLGGTAIRELPPSFGNLNALNVLNLGECKNLVSLPNGICNLKSLRNLTLFGCSKLENLPADLGKLDLLELVADETAINQLPSSIICLNDLVKLTLCGCKGQNFAKFPLPPLSALRSLQNLYMKDCDLLEFPVDITSLTLLANLSLGGNNFKSIPASIKQLAELQRLDLSNCKRLQSIPELPPDLKYVGAHGCTSLETVSSTSAVFPKWLDSLSRHMLLYTNCSSLNGNARSNIVADAKQKIQLLATASCKLYSRFLPTPSVTFGFPGSEVPEWFSYQSNGTSVTIRLPACWHYPKFLGFAFCVIVAFNEHYDDSHFRIRCESEYQDIYCNLDGGYYEDKPKFDGSDHVFLLYDHSLYLMAVKGEEGEFETSFRFYPIDEDKKPLRNCSVKRCGVHLLFAHENRIRSPKLIKGYSSFGNMDVINQDMEKSMEEEGIRNKRYRDDGTYSGAEPSRCGIDNSNGVEDPKKFKGVN